MDNLQDLLDRFPSFPRNMLISSRLTREVQGVNERARRIRRSLRRIRTSIAF